MAILLLNIIAIPSLILSKLLFKRWINHISVYTVIWYIMIFLYQLKLINYYDISSTTWTIIIISYLVIWLGALTYFSARNSFISKNNPVLIRNNLYSVLFANNGKVLFWLSLVFGLIGLFSAFQTLHVILSLYPSVFEILLHLGKIYQMRVSGEIKGIIPYLSVFIFASIFFSAIYSALHKRIKLIALLPIAAMIIKELVLAGRVSILLGFLEFFFTFLFTLYFLRDNGLLKNTNFKFLTMQFIFLISLFILSIVAIKNLRGAVETFKGETRILKTQSTTFISPSIYLYLSGDIGVLNKYLEQQNERTKIGENTFLFVYNVLSKFGITKRPNGYQKAYYIPVWINTGTYLRELIADFSLPGALTFIFLLSFVSALSWSKFFFNADFKYLAILVFAILIFSLSFLMIITRLANIVLSLIFIYSVLWGMEKYAYTRSQNKILQ